MNYRLQITDNNVAISVYANEVSYHKSRHAEVTQCNKMLEPWLEKWTLRSKSVQFRTPLFPKLMEALLQQEPSLKIFTQTLAGQSSSNTLGQFANQSLPTAPRLVDYCLKSNTDPGSSIPSSVNPSYSSISLVRSVIMYAARTWEYTVNTLQLQTFYQELLRSITNLRRIKPTEVLQRKLLVCIPMKVMPES
jgi:hypothetical protein